MQWNSVTWNFLLMTIPQPIFLPKEITHIKFPSMVSSPTSYFHNMSEAFKKNSKSTSYCNQVVLKKKKEQCFSPPGSWIATFFTLLFVALMEKEVYNITHHYIFWSHFLLKVLWLPSHSTLHGVIHDSSKQISILQVLILSYSGFL